MEKQEDLQRAIGVEILRGGSVSQITHVQRDVIVAAGTNMLLKP